MVSETDLVGRRVRVTGILPNDPAPLKVGEEGVVTGAPGAGTPFAQIVVTWDSGRSLLLLPDDPFEVLP